MKKLLLLLSIVFIGQIHGQNWQWAKSAYGINSSGDEGVSITTDSIGNSFITGSYISPTITMGTYTLTNAGGQDVVIAKYDSFGNIIWANSVSGSGYESGLGITSDKLGNIYLAGMFDSPSLVFGTYTLTTTSPSSGFVVKYNSTGAVLWAKKLGGTSYDNAQAITIDAVGNIYVLGRMNSSTMTIGSYTITNSGGTFIAKYNSSGNVLWAKGFGGLPYSICNNGKYIYITGMFSSPQLIYGLDTLSSGGNASLFLAQLDTSGNAIWGKDAIGISEGMCVTTDASNNVILTGDFDSPSLIFDNDTIYNNGAGGTNDIFILKCNNHGNLLWSKSIGGSGNWDKGWAVITDASSNIYHMGGFDSPKITIDSDTLFSPSGSLDPMFIAQYDSSGNLLCHSILASGGDDNSGLALDKYGNLYFCGDFYHVNPFIVGPDTLILGSQYAENIFVAKFTCSSSNSIKKYDSQVQINIYPNPTSDQFFIDANTTDKLIVDLYDVNGRHVFSKSVSDKSNVSVATLDNGIYSMTIKFVDRVTNKKLVIVR